MTSSESLNSKVYNLSVDLLVVGGGYRATTFLASCPELWGLSILVIDPAGRLGAGNLSRFDTLSSSAGAGFFRYVSPVTLVTLGLADDANVCAIAQSRGPQRMSLIAHSLDRLGAALSAEISLDVISGTVESIDRERDFFNVRLEGGGVVVSRRCVLASGRTETLQPGLRPHAAKTVLSGEMLDVNQPARTRTERLLNRTDGAIRIVGGSHSAFAVAAQLIRDGAVEHRRLEIMHRSPLRLCYASAADAAAEIDAALRLDPSEIARRTSPGTGIVNRDSGLRNESATLCRAIVRGEIPEVSAVAIENIESETHRLERASLIVQATGYRGNAPQLSLYGSSFHSPFDRLWTDERGAVYTDDGLTSSVPGLYAIRVEPTPAHFKDCGDFASRLYANVGVALERWFGTSTRIEDAAS